MTLASDGLANRLRPLLSKMPGVVERKVIGGIGFMHFGNLLVSTTPKGDLLVRIDPAQAKVALSRDGASQAMMGAREMSGYVAVGPEGTRSVADLKDWIAYALKHVKTLPPK